MRPAGLFLVPACLVGVVSVEAACTVNNFSKLAKASDHPQRGPGNCVRRTLAPDYLAKETACAVDAGRKLRGLYQFGVPTEMATTIPVLRARGVHYDSYLGFDSFEGLPPEDDTKSMRPAIWVPGMFNERYRRSKDFKVVKSKDGYQHYVPRDGLTGVARPLSVTEAVESWRAELNATENRITLVPGFYNQSLTPTLARTAPVALYVDINCDLYISTYQALDWLFHHRLARRGTLISYDDWFNVPLGNGESLAHEEIAAKYKVKFQYLPHHDCVHFRRLVWFRVLSVGGERAESGITASLKALTG